LVFESRRGIGKVSKSPRKSKGTSYRGNAARRNSFPGTFFKSLLIALAIGLFILLGAGIYGFNMIKGLPEVDKIAVNIPNETTKIYSADNVLLADLHKEENRVVVHLSDISQNLKTALVAMEDSRFYRHHGIDIRAIFRALSKDIIKRKAVEGASTLTQQLARNVFLTKEKTLSRKLGEIVLAFQIERKYTKEEIMEMYLNQVYWGHNAYGIESASQLYFGKHASNLSLAESAMLVGLLKGPEIYSPYKDMNAAKERQESVLGRLITLGYITEAQGAEGLNQPIVLAGLKKVQYRAPYFTSYVIDQLIRMLGENEVYSSGMKVYTTLDYQLQQYAENAVQRAIDRVGRTSSANFSEAALLSINPRTGYILGMVGGKDYLNSEFNRATQSYRQPGSAFKPFAYLSALDRGLSPGTVMDDSAVTYNTYDGAYVPQNYDKQYSGSMPLRRALELSKNVVAVKISDLIGANSIIDTAKNLGINSKLQNILSLPLGACEVSMMEMAYAYGVLANRGIKTKPISIFRIEDRNGIEIYRNRVETSHVFNENMVNVLVDMMKGVILNGTGRGAALPRPMAGKTGTTSDYKDAWFIGFVPQMVTSTWVGNDNNTPMNNVTGGGVPAKIWRDYMKNALQNIPVMDFPKPKDLIPVKICWDSGLKATEYCRTDRVSVEKFWKDKVPDAYCNVHFAKKNGNAKPGVNWLDEFFGENNNNEMSEPEPQEPTTNREDMDQPE